MAKSRFRPGWKKNFLKLPEHIRAAVMTLQGDELIVACVKRIPASSVRLFRHLGLSVLADGELGFTSPVTPPAGSGKFSERNIYGHTVVRKDLPMEPRTYTFDAPNFGDWTKGSHEVEWTRDVYPRDVYPPKDLALGIELLRLEPGPEPTYVVKFAVGRTLNAKAPGFRNELLFDVNLLQENTGGAAVYPADAKVANFLRTFHINWEILPPGERDKTVAAILSRYRAPTKAVQEKLYARYKLLDEMNPQAFISGTNGFRRYFGAQFEDNLVVFENLDYGNAIYVMFDGWEELSKRSRLDLLSGSRAGFDRITHRGDWEDDLRELVAKRRKNNL
ncbi:MAG TPA: hypothetical protein VF796_06150 [Humisphaera sp.]